MKSKYKKSVLFLQEVVLFAVGIGMAVLADFLESIGAENMKKMDDYTKISLKALGVDLIAWPVAFILTFLIVTYANDLAQYISGYFFVSACLLADGISVYKFKGDFLNEKNVGEEGYYLLKVRMYVGLGLGAIAFCGMIVSLIRYLIHLL